MNEASNQQQISVINKFEGQKSGRYDENRLEKEKFNTGPCAGKHLPTHFHIVTGNSQIESAPITNTHSSPAENHHTPAQAQVHSDDSSNISVNSEKEVENVETKNASNPHQQPESNKGRKRKRLDFTPKLDQKRITDYQQHPPNDQNFTRVGIVAAYSSSDSDSNQSPSSSAPSARIDKGVQTTENFDPTETAKQDGKKAKEAEGLLRANIDLKHKIRASKETIKRLLVEQSRMERKQAKQRVMEATLRIGQIRSTRLGEHFNFKDQWIDGWDMEEITKKLKRIELEREEIDNATQNLKKRKPTKEAKRQPNSHMPSTSNNAYTEDNDGFLRPELPKEMTALEYTEQEEIYRLRKEHLKKEEAAEEDRREALARERNLHIREMKRVESEEQSRFKDHILLHDRYVLLSLLGKGGFGEVWRAFDLDENRYVACKIHQVNKDWKDEKKANYVKHAMREKDIHKSLDHPRIVRLFDVFPIDNDAFCTVLEYCDGNDLDFYLKQHKQIPEKEARCIIMQVVNALKYLGEQKHPIIHYDLKPANILLQSGTTSGEIKITDFGLSKTIENADDGNESIELTSQGAGTYCAVGTKLPTGGPPKISNKVDVWSVGVIFYQCIYGERPFGHEKTQQQILEQRTIFNAQEVTFLSKPPVSAAAQDFIRRCLQYRREERADVNELMRHELFRPRLKKSLQPPSPSSKCAQEGFRKCEEIGKKRKQ